MTKEQMKKQLRLMRVSLKHSITYLNNKHKLNEEDKEYLEIYQDQLEALDMSLDKLEKLEELETILEKVWKQPSCMIDKSESLDSIMEVYKGVRND